MRKIATWTLILIAVLLTGSCQKSDPVKLQYSTITATIQVSKTELGWVNDDGVEQLRGVVWTDKDAFKAVLFGKTYTYSDVGPESDSRKFELKSGAGTKSGYFIGGFSMSDLVESGACALYPADQSGTAKNSNDFSQIIGQYAYMNLASNGGNYDLDRYYSGSGVFLDDQRYGSRQSSTSDVQGGIQRGRLPMYAIVRKGEAVDELQFHHICGILRLVFDSSELNSSQTIGTVTLSPSIRKDDFGHSVCDTLHTQFYINLKTGETAYSGSSVVKGAALCYGKEENTGKIRISGCGDTMVGNGYVKVVDLIVPPLNGTYDLGFNDREQFKDKTIEVAAGQIRTIHIRMKKRK